MACEGICVAPSASPAPPAPHSPCQMLFHELQMSPATPFEMNCRCRHSLEVLVVAVGVQVPVEVQGSAALMVPVVACHDWVWSLTPMRVVWCPRLTLQMPVPAQEALVDVQECLFMKFSCRRNLQCLPCSFRRGSDRRRVLKMGSTRKTRVCLCGRNALILRNVCRS